MQQAKSDQIGLDLRLPSGNVGSRILPVRIHNLDLEDEKLLEQTMGRQLRTIDFVYQELGVNRPLRPEDDEVNRTAGGLLYRNQINKVANAIKELVAAVRPLVASGHSGAQPAPPVAAAAGAANAAPVSGKPVVFVAWTAKELLARREELALVCTKAGLHVVPASDCPLDEGEFRTRTQEAVASATCAVHLLGNEFGRRFEEDEECSFPMYACLPASAPGGSEASRLSAVCLVLRR
ncbi:MAG: hypothetical protein EOO55_01725 [Hymenobacter sp.]|nr:MAG: hypothetical protein EOO55_01725 [Hymenobacter sp.]